MEGLLAGAVQDEHTGHLALDAVAERMRAQMKAAGLLDVDGEDVAGAAGADWVASEEEMRGLTAVQVASRLPDHDVAMLWCGSWRAPPTRPAAAARHTATSAPSGRSWPNCSPTTSS
ncbi:hypothetical protein [Streptomyces sp. NPDC001381]|uniref:hypothetical protein n=1 Tax=Streptomyces sp. NPDC001381 TaxID=3364567 RepID=UPI0036C81348